MILRARGLGIGTRCAMSRAMGVRHHRDLEAWRLADEVRRAWLDVTARPDAARDFDFVTQTRRAANSACRNLAEGFWRFRHREFANFVNIAKGSLGELADSADEAREKRYITDDEYRALDGLIGRALAAATALHGYLRRTPTPRT